MTGCPLWARSSVAEQGTHNPLVAGSNPAGPTYQPRRKPYSLGFINPSSYDRPGGALVRGGITPSGGMTCDLPGVSVRPCHLLGDTDITQYTWDHRNRLVKVEHRAGYAAAVDRVIENAYDFQNRSHPPAAGRRRGRAHRPASPLRLRRQPDRPGLLAEQWPTRLTSRRREPAVRTWRQVVNGSAFPPRADARGSIRPKR